MLFSLAAPAGFTIPAGRYANLAFITCRGVAHADIQPPPAIDVLVLDVMLPELDGYEVLRGLRADARGKELPVLMLTARGFALDDEDLAIGNIREVLSKPFSPRAILQRVKELIAFERDAA